MPSGTMPVNWCSLRKRNVLENLMAILTGFSIVKASKSLSQTRRLRPHKNKVYDACVTKPDLGDISMRLHHKRSMLIAGAMLAVAAFAVATNAQTPKFKVGDRVTVDTNMSTTPAYSSWKNGT